MEKQSILKISQSAESLLTLTLQSEYWPGLCRKTREVTPELADDDIKRLVKCYYLPIRSIAEMDVKAALIIELEYCARTYGAKSTEHIEDVMYECLTLMTNRFMGLAVEEVRLAFQLKAAGVIRPKGAEMYGGAFNADVLGKIMTAYRDWRQAAIKPAIEYLEAIRLQEQEDERKRRGQEWFEENFDRLLFEARSKYDSWDMVPAHFYDGCKRREYFTINKAEADEYLERAVKLVEAEATVERQSKPRHLIRLEPQLNPDERAKIIARKLVVLEKVLKNDDSPVWSKFYQDVNQVFL